MELQRHHFNLTEEINWENNHLPFCAFFWCKLSIFCNHFINVAETKKNNKYQEIFDLKPGLWNEDLQEHGPDYLN